MVGARRVEKLLVLLAAVGCAPEYAAVPTTSARIPNVRVESYGIARVKPEANAEPVEALHVRTTITNGGATPATFDAREQRVEAKHHASGAAYLVLSAILLVPFIVVPSGGTGVVDLYYPIPQISPASSLPGSGELPGTVDVVSTLHTDQGITTQRTILSIPLNKAWTPP